MCSTGSLPGGGASSARAEGRRFGGGWGSARDPGPVRGSEPRQSSLEDACVFRGAAQMSPYGGAFPPIHKVLPPPFHPLFQHHGPFKAALDSLRLPASPLSSGGVPRGEGRPARQPRVLEQRPAQCKHSNIQAGAAYPQRPQQRRNPLQPPPQAAPCQALLKIRPVKPPREYPAPAPKCVPGPRRTRGKAGLSG